MTKLSPEQWRAAVPPELAALDRWVGWRAKVPLHPERETAAKAGVPATWGTFAQACEFYERMALDPTAGAGFEFNRDGYVGVDLDLALDERGEPYPWAAALLWDFEVLGVGYVEVSPSGRGLHVILRGQLPRNPNRVELGGVVEGKKKSGVEVYGEKRYFTFTGRVWRGRGDLGGDGQAALDALLAVTGLDRRLAEPAPEVPGPAGTDPGRAGDVKSALDALDPDMPYQEWVEVGMAIRAGLGDAGRKLWVGWSRRGKKYRPGDPNGPEAKWPTFRGSGIGLGSLFKRAQATGWEMPDLSAEDEFGKLPLPPEALPVIVPYHRAKRGGKTEIVKSAGNLALYFSREKRWAGRLRFNVRRGPELDGSPLTDHGYTSLGSAAERDMAWGAATAVEHLYRGVELAAREREYDPIREYILREEWDGEDRLDLWLVRAGAPDTPANRMMGRRFMIGAAGRGLFEPQPGVALPPGHGTKMDYVLVLEGEQGQKKSWVCEALCPPGYFFDSHFDFKNPKDFYQALAGHFVVEMAELDALRRSEISTVKAIITSRTDAYRASYGRTVERHPRRAVLTGTANDSQWIHDLTGGRRFWPVAVRHQMDVAWVEGNRAQLWAEAARRYRAGETYWEDDEMRLLVKDLQDARVVVPGWHGVLEDFLDQPDVRRRGYVTRGYLQDSIRILAMVNSADLAKSLHRIGWRAEAPRVDGVTRRIWVPESAPRDHNSLARLVRANPLPGVPGDPLLGG